MNSLRCQSLAQTRANRSESSAEVRQSDHTYSVAASKIQAQVQSRNIPRLTLRPKITLDHLFLCLAKYPGQNPSTPNRILKIRLRDLSPYLLNRIETHRHLLSQPPRASDSAEKTYPWTPSISESVLSCTAPG